MEQNKSKTPQLLLILLVWILFTLGVLGLGYPKMRQAVQESGVLTLLAQNEGSSTAIADTRVITAAFILPSQATKLFTYRAPRYGSSAYHDTFEALLAPLPQAALAEGAISTIDSNTRLRGLTLSNSILYVDLSRAFYSSANLASAIRQIEATAHAFSAVKGVVILVEGAPIDLSE